MAILLSRGDLRLWDEKINNLSTSVQESPSLGDAMAKGYTIGGLITLLTDWNAFYAEATDGALFDIVTAGELEPYKGRYLTQRDAAARYGLAKNGSSLSTGILIGGALLVGALVYSAANGSDYEDSDDE